MWYVPQASGGRIGHAQHTLNPSRTARDCQGRGKELIRLVSFLAGGSRKVNGEYDSENRVTSSGGRSGRNRKVGSAASRNGARKQIESATTFQNIAEHPELASDAVRRCSAWRSGTRPSCEEGIDPARSRTALAEPDRACPRPGLRDPSFRRASAMRALLDSCQALASGPCPDPGPASTPKFASCILAARHHASAPLALPLETATHCLSWRLLTVSAPPAPSTRATPPLAGSASVGAAARRRSVGSAGSGVSLRLWVCSPLSGRHRVGSRSGRSQAPSGSAAGAEELRGPNSDARSGGRRFGAQRT
jgi:hypothetical protein